MIHEPPTVRLATENDVEGIIALCWLAQRERNERTPCERKAREMVANCLNGNGAIGIIEVDGDYRAMCGLVKSSPWCSEDVELYDWLTYVRTDCRHLRYLTPLLKFARGQATEQGIVLWMGWIGDERSEAKSKAYQRRYPKYGEFYRFDPRAMEAA
jgi:hypothetical protein